MKINIYQINHDRDDKRLMFFGLDEVQKLTGSKMVKAEIYDKIFSGDVDCPSLESDSPKPSLIIVPSPLKNEITVVPALFLYVAAPTAARPFDLK